MNLRNLLACAAAALLCSCTSTSVKETWKSPDYSAGPLKKVAVLAIDERRDVRIGFENRLARAIDATGSSASLTYDQLSLSEINSDKKAAAERFRSAGAEAVVIMKLRDASSIFRESRPGHERYAGVVTGIEPGFWYDYYSVAYADISPTYGNLKQTVYLETSVFDLTTAKRLWSGLTKTVMPEGMDRVAEMDPLAAKVIKAMQQDGILP